MKSTLQRTPILIWTLFFSFSILSWGQNNAPDIEEKVPQVALLGMFHFGETNDLASIKIEQILGEQRQNEILNLVDYLAKYKPTKILLEYPFIKTDTLNAKYHQYVKGQFELTENEIYQIGFRLAKKLDHNNVYGIDHRMDLPFETLMNYCQENNRMDEMQNFISMIQQYTSQETEELSKTNLTEFLHDMNSDTYDRMMNKVYLQDMFAYGTPENEVGVELTSAWYKRNLIMLNNISRTIETPEDRILVIIGGAHRAMIKDFILTRDDMKYTEISDYMK